MSYIRFPCDCRFKVAGDDNPGETVITGLEKLPRVDISLNPWDEDSIYRISTTCEATWNLIGEGRTKGVFQLETQFGQQWAKKAKPQSIEDLAALVALLRPGCVRAMSGDPPKSMAQRYVDRKHSREEVVYLHKAIEHTLETTFGVLVYQEQAMRIAEEVAAFNKQEADVLRKAIGKKKADVMAKVEKEFVEKAEQAKIITLEEAKEIFGWIRESQKYSFNKSHAVAYGMDSYWSAYIKAHFPLSFYGAWILGANWKNADKYEEIAELVNDAKLSSIEIKTPQLPYVTPHTTIVNDDFIQFGLTEVKGIGKATVEIITEKLKEITESLGKPAEQWTWLEYLIFAAPKLAKDVNLALISIGALDYMGGTRRAKLFEFEQFLNLKKDTEVAWMQANFRAREWPDFLSALRALAPARKIKGGVQVAGGGTSSIKRQQVVEGIVYMIENPPSKLVDAIDWIAFNEETYLGVPITATKVEGCLEACEANTTCKEFLDGKTGWMLLAVEVVSKEELKTKSGKNPGSKMARIMIRDKSCSINGVVFPKQWSQFGSMFYPGNTIMIQAEPTKDGGLSVLKAKEIS